MKHRLLNKKKDRISSGLFKDSAEQNAYAFNFYMERLLNLAVSRFTWNNLPDTIDPRYLEMTLLIKGYAVYFNDEVLGNLALECAAGGKINIYRIPTRREILTANGYHTVRYENDSVLIYNNMMHMPTADTLQYFALRLSDMERTIDVNLKAQKTPCLILCDETQRLTMLNLYKQYDGNQPFIFGNNMIDPSMFSVLKTDAPYVADKVYKQKLDLFNECLSYLGILNPAITKAERVNVSEVNMSVGGTMANRNSFLNERMSACDKINAMFGTNLSVQWNDGVDNDALLMASGMDDVSRETSDETSGEEGE